MKKIPLSKGKTALVDSKLYKILIATGPWCAKHPGNKWYAFNNQHGYMHRVIWELKKGKCPPKLDHKNRDGLDNRIRNLRPASHSQNLLNRGCQSNSTTGLKNVSFDKMTGRFSARVQRDGKSIWLGRHDTAQIAAQVVKDFIVSNDKEFACFK